MLALRTVFRSLHRTIAQVAKTLSRWWLGVPSVALAALVFWRCGGSPTSPTATCAYNTAISASHCGCDVGPAVDLGAADTAGLQLWPFGVHAQSGHVEGHRGLDVSSNTQPLTVRSPFNGTVTSIDNAQDSSGTMVLEFGTTPRFTTIAADCGLGAKLIPVLLDAGIVAGTRVTKGQRLGVLAELIPPYGPHQWSTHFEIDAKPSSDDTALYAVCPADLFPASDVATLNGILNASSYPEKLARTVTITCDNQTTIQMTFPAEGLLCNARLDQAARAKLAACVPSKASIIW
jgi:hypothetical protein